LKKQKTALRFGKNQNYQIGMSLMSMYDHCDDFDPNYNSSITDEENLRNYAKILLSELKPSHFGIDFSRG
jgi:hypothetical protein